MHTWAFLRGKAYDFMKAWVSNLGVKHRAKRVGQQGY